MSRKKILFTSHTANFHKFNRPFMRMLRGTLEEPYGKYNIGGWEVHYASANEEGVLDCDKSFKVDFARSPFRIDKHVKAYRQLSKILRDNHFDIIHTHTPVGSIITRLAARKVRKNGARVIYTNHGAHFLKGGPLLGWLLWFPVEYYCSGITDEIVTINLEDYERFKRYMRCKVSYLNGGVGVDMKKFTIKKMSTAAKKVKRGSLGLSSDDYVIIYIAELIPRKNHRMAIEAMRQLIVTDPEVHLLLVGADGMRGGLQSMVRKYGIDGNVHFLGYRNDVAELCQISDLAIATSRQEGFGIGIVEALASGLPVIATRIRGHSELVELVELVELDNYRELAHKINLAKSRKNITKTLPRKYRLQNALEFHQELYK